jgi:hypothetical protein
MSDEADRARQNLTWGWVASLAGAALPLIGGGGGFLASWLGGKAGLDVISQLELLMALAAVPTGLGLIAGGVAGLVGLGFTTMALVQAISDDERSGNERLMRTSVAVASGLTQAGFLVTAATIGAVVGGFSAMIWVLAAGLSGIH